MKIHRIILILAMLFHDSNAVFRPLLLRGIATGSGLRQTWRKRRQRRGRPPGHGRLGTATTGDAFARRLG